MTRSTPREALTAWLFLAPALSLLAVFVFWPMAYLIWLGFTDGGLREPFFVGFANYERLFASGRFLQVLFNTAVFTVGAVVPSVGLALPVAAVLEDRVPLRAVLRSAYFLPTAVSLVVAAVAFRWLFHPQGWVNALTGLFGAPPLDWLGDPAWAMPVLVAVTVWKQLGFNVILFLAALGTVPRSRYEAAALDGASGWQQFWHIALPGIRPTLIFAVVTTVIFTFRSFEPVYVMTGGGPLGTTSILVYYVWEQAFGLFNFGLSAAAAGVLLAGVLAVTALQLWFAGREGN
jgi:multiple sugar transport system permease protein